MATEPGSVMSADEMSALSKKHTMFDWVPQDAVVPMPIEYAKGVYMYTPDGDRILDFNSQLMSVNIGHGDQRVIDAITAQAQKVCYVHPYTATEPRAELGRKLAQITPGDLDVWFFTNGGAEANENAIRIARHYTGRQKILARSRSYHGAVGSTIVATGDPRRWGAEIGVSGIVRAPDFHKWGKPDPEPVDVALRELEEVIMYEGAQNIAGFILEPIVGTNGILIPPDGYMQGVRDICTQHGIMLIADEVMSGFGRTGEWFAVDLWGIEPDLMSIAKGLTSSYVQLGALGMSRKVADTWGDKPFPAGLTYNSHALACATALAVIDVYEQDDLIARAKRMGEIMAGHHARLAQKHRSVGRTRNKGMFGIIELVRSHDPYEPMAPYNGTSDEMKAIGAYFKQHGLFTFLRFGMIHTNPPLTITEEELAEGFDIIDGALDLADGAVRA
jgi:taurine--2-oxoglutarate transaminase